MGVISAPLMHIHTTFQVLATTTLATTVLTVGPAQGASFRGLGEIEFPNNFSSLVVLDISADGSTVGGSLGPPESRDNEGFIWQESTGVELGFSAVSSLSADGSTFATAGGFTVGSRADYISGDGSVFVRTNGAEDRGGPGDTTVSVSGFGDISGLPGKDYTTFARDISTDGSTVVGTSATVRAPGVNGNWYQYPVFDTTEAFAWSADQGTRGLGDLSGGSDFSSAYGVSADGTTVVGQSSSGNGPEAFAWNAATGMIGLGDLSGGAFSSLAEDVSADGKSIVGFATTDQGEVPFLWTETAGMRSIQQLLTDDFNLDLTGWTLTGRSVISDDGLTIAGQGINPNGQSEAWLARLDAPDTSSESVPEPSGLLGLALLGGFGVKLKQKHQKSVG